MRCSSARLELDTKVRRDRQLRALAAVRLLILEAKIYFRKAPSLTLQPHEKRQRVVNGVGEQLPDQDCVDRATKTIFDSMILGGPF